VITADRLVITYRDALIWGGRHGLLDVVSISAFDDASALENASGEKALTLTKLLLAAALLLSALWRPGPANAESCRLALVLAFDVSISVDEREDRLQREGAAEALLSPEIARALFAAPGAVAMYAFEWSSHGDQKMMLDWTAISSPDDLARAAAIIAASQRSRADLPTGIGEALGHAITALRHGPDCPLRTIDVSGDGVNNDGYSPEIAYRAFDFSGVTVNGLAVQGAETQSEAELIDYYQSEVLHGPGAFLEVADGYDDYARAMRRKLFREVSELTLSMADPARFVTGYEGINTQ
jgi:Protein of unknown function (DUF1194)